MRSILCANHTIYERRDRLRLFRGDLIGRLDQAPRFRKAPCCVVMQRAERLAAFHGVSNAFVKLEPYGRIDCVFLLFTAAAQHHTCHAQLFALRRGDESVGWAGHLKRLPRMWQPPGIIDHPYVSPLQTHDLPEFFPRSPRKNIHAASSRHNSRRSAGPAPLNTSIDSATSMALPAFRPRGWFISVSSATTFFPMRLPVSTSNSARFAASSIFFMKAPDPVFTSSTSASIPSANFLLMMDAQISAGLSTVPVTSRRA